MNFDEVYFVSTRHKCVTAFYQIIFMHDEEKNKF